jgi:hypothetical protein
LIWRELYKGQRGSRIALADSLAASFATRLLNAGLLCDLSLFSPFGVSLSLLDFPRIWEYFTLNASDSASAFLLAKDGYLEIVAFGNKAPFWAIAVKKAVLKLRFKARRHCL